MCRYLNSEFNFIRTESPGTTTTDHPSAPKVESLHSPYHLPYYPPTTAMAPTPCQLCHTARALVKRPKTGQQVCKTCFFEVFETEVHNTIVEGNGIFRRGERVAIGASGGKGQFTHPFGGHYGKKS